MGVVFKGTALAAVLLLAACEGGVTAGGEMRGMDGPVDRIAVTGSSGGEFTISGDASAGVVGTF